MSLAAPGTPQVTLIGQMDWPQNLYLARALHEAGWDVHMLSDGRQPRELATWLKVHQVDFADEHALAAHVRRLEQDPNNRWILPLDEAGIFVCHDAAPESTKLVPKIKRADLDMLQKKSGMAAFARSLGVPTPEWECVHDIHHAFAVAERLGYPAVLKGEWGHAGNQVVICQDSADLRTGLKKLEGQRTLLQRHIRGASWACGGFFHRGALTHLHGYEIVQQQPVGSGPASFVRHEHPPEMVESLTKLGAALEWSGYMQADFIRDENGTFWFLEINPRPWGSMTAALAAGNPIFAPLVALLAGQTPSCGPQEAREWSACVFPKPVLGLAREHRGAEMLMTALKPSFWRGAPRTDLSLMLYFAKLMYWDWRRPNERATRSSTPERHRALRGFHLNGD